MQILMRLSESGEYVVVVKSGNYSGGKSISGGKSLGSSNNFISSSIKFVSVKDNIEYDNSRFTFGCQSLGLETMEYSIADNCEDS